MKGSWRRIAAFGMACFMVLTSVDTSSLTVLAADDKLQEDVKTDERPLMSGLKKIEWIKRTESVSDEGKTEDKHIDSWQTYASLYNDAWDKYSTYYYYNQISDEWKAIWDELDVMCLDYLLNDVDAEKHVDEYQNVRYFTKNLELPEGTTIEDGQNMMYMFMASKPQYYFLESVVQYGLDGTGKYMTSVAIGIYPEFADGQKRAGATKTLKYHVDYVINELVPKDANEEEKLRIAHDYIVNKVEYNYDILGDGRIDDEEEYTYFTQSAYSVLGKDLAVCTGYTEALQILCNGLGIDTITVTSEDHAWNKVRINDSWYNVDVTWADAGSGKSILYTYYGVSDYAYTSDIWNEPNEILSHTVEKFWEPYMPVCAQGIQGGHATEPGTFPVPEKTLDAPVITVVPEGDKYLVTITGNVEGQEFYYALNGMTPDVAYRKATKYTGPFYVEEGYYISAMTAKDGYYDSNLTRESKIPDVENVKADDSLYKEITISWDSLGTAVDGYEIVIFNRETQEKLKTVLVTADKTSYVYDTTEWSAGLELEFRVCAYVQNGSYRLRSKESIVYGTVAEAPKVEIKVEKIEDQIYTGNFITPNVQITANDKVLVDGKDYTLSYKNNRNVGTAKVTVTFMGDYTGVAETEFVILPKEVDETFEVTFADGMEYTYTGKEITPKVTIKAGGTVLVKDQDYTVSYSNNIEVGTNAVVTITYIGNYTGSSTEIFAIISEKMSDPVIGVIADQVYTGKEITPEVQISVDDKQLVLGEDYTLSYSNNINAGKAKVTITFIGAYTGIKETEFTILPKEFDGTFEVAFAESVYTYTGEAITPEVIIKAGGVLLVKDQDYAVSYENNIHVGSDATINITYMGNYTGKTKDAFIIMPMQVENLVIGEIADQVYTGEEVIPEFLVSAGELEFVIGTDYDVVFAEDADNINVGEVKLQVVLKGDYKGSAEASFRIIPLNVSEEEGVGIKTIADQKYTGQEIKPEVIILGKFVFVEGKDYTVSYENNISAGTASVILTFKGNYTGTLTKNFMIVNGIPMEITSSNVTIDKQNGYISKISVQTTVQKFINSLNEKDFVSVFDKNNKKLDGSAVLGTGMKVAIMEGNNKGKEYSIIVTGDTNGDGKINITDMIAVKAATLKKSDLTGVYAKAADVNGDGKVNITDFIKVKATILKKDTITGVSAK